jgi:hypothetical protein
MDGNPRSYLIPGLLVMAVLLVALSLVLVTLSRPEPQTYAPSPVRASEVGEVLVGPVVYTIDASDTERWRFFDFSRGSRVEPEGSLEWDLAFRRHEIIVNGGSGFEGAGGARIVSEESFGEVAELPGTGYEETEAGRDSMNPALEKWYDYGFTTHLLQPRPVVYGIRTADGRYAKVELVSYYCPGARSGCVTFRYVYQGDGTRKVTPAGD